MSNNHIERIGVHGVGQIFEKLKWNFNELHVGDKGIDAVVEYRGEEGVYNLLAIQIKSGHSYFVEKTEEGYVFRFDEEHKKYWLTYQIPVIVVTYNHDKSLCFWQEININTVVSTGKDYKVIIPEHNILEESKKELLEISNVPEDVRNYMYLKSGIELMNFIEEGYDLILESEEWVNKSSGRGETKLYVYFDEKLITTYEYNYWFPYQLYQDVFKRLFPWAKFEVDEDFYEDEDITNYNNEHCPWDPEDKKYYDGDISYSEYLSTLPEIRYVDFAGEVGRYKLHLSLNELGEAFLKVNEYLETGKTYKNLKPTKIN